VFNIGTGHSQTEPNNTFAALWSACTSPCYVNDGPGADEMKLSPGNMQGWGMNDKCSATVAAIKNANPKIVNMTGHSRGAILCHMIAHALFQDPVTAKIKLNLILLDPVHQSKMKHEGAEELDNNPNLMSYCAIIMENEDQTLLGKKMYPFKIVQVPAPLLKRVHYIRMPGKHGSGSQNLTSPVGKVVFELIQQLMRAKGTTFNTAPPTAHDMCEYFALIHMLNPMVLPGKRIVFDDPGHALTHQVTGSEEIRSTRDRDEALKQVNLINQKATQQGYQNRFAKQYAASFPNYFINEEHAYHFSKAFPCCFFVLSNAPQKSSMRRAVIDLELGIMEGRPGLNHARPLIQDYIYDLLL
jgi:hypothetical protein